MSGSSTAVPENMLKPSEIDAAGRAAAALKTNQASGACMSTATKVAVCSALLAILGAVTLGLALAGVLPNLGSIHSITNLPAFLSTTIASGFVIGAGICLAAAIRYYTNKERKQSSEFNGQLNALRSQLASYENVIRNCTFIPHNEDRFSTRDQVVRNYDQHIGEVRKEYDQHIMEMESVIQELRDGQEEINKDSADTLQTLTDTQDAVERAQIQISELTAALAASDSKRGKPQAPGLEAKGSGRRPSALRGDSVVASRTKPTISPAAGSPAWRYSYHLTS